MNRFREWLGPTLRIALGVALLMLAARAASAAPSEADREKARALAAEGYEALQQKLFAVAEDRFRRADKLVHAPSLVVDHARALIGLGRLVEAHERYELVLREGVPATAPWPWKRALQDAEQEIDLIKPRLAWITVTVIGPEHPTVFIDGRRVPSAAVGVPRAVNPGRRIIAARARGFSSKEQEITLAEGQRMALELALEPKPEGAPEEPEPPEPPRLEDLPPPVFVSESGGLRRTLGYVAFTAGAVGLVVGGVTSALAVNARSDLSARCPRGVCELKRESDRSDYEQDIARYELFKTASTVSLSFGVAAAATGVCLLVFKGGGTEVSGERRSLSPMIGLGSVAVKGSF